MNGNLAYVKKYETKLNNIVELNKDKNWILGFINYMTDQAESTKYDYVNHVLKFIEFLNNKDVDKINFDDYTAYLSSISDKTSSYRISVYSGLKKFSKYLNASHRNQYNPMEDVNRPKFVEKESTISKRNNGYLEKDEISILINNIESGVGNKLSHKKQLKWKNRDKLIIQLFLNTGLRCSGIYKIDIDSIDFDNKILTVTEKRDKVRIFNLSDDIMKLIYMWAIDRKRILNGNNERALFISNQKTRMDQSSIARVVKKYSQGIDNKNITPHKLRATYGTHLYNETNDIYFVQECMGHNNPKTTELYIRGNTNKNSQKAAEIMSSLLF